MEQGRQIRFGFSNHAGRNEVCSHFLKITQVQKKLVGNSLKRRENKNFVDGPFLRERVCQAVGFRTQTIFKDGHFWGQVGGGFN